MAALDDDTLPPTPPAPLDPVATPVATTKAPAAPVVSKPPAPVTFRRFDDIDGQREAIYQNAATALTSRAPVENDTHRIEITDIGYAKDYAPTRADEKKALLEGGKLHRPLKGVVRLIDKLTGQVLDERKTVLAHVPHLNSRGLFIQGGTPYALRNQARLRAGVYVRKQQNGGVEAQFNIKQGTGRGFRVNLDPETGVFKLQIKQSETRLYPLLKALGVEDDQLKQAWGDDLFKANWREISGHDHNDLRKVVEKLGRGKEREAPPEQLAETFRSILERNQIDPDVSELTLGARHEKPSLDVILATTQKILRVANGEEGDDNRDSLAFQSFHAAEDLIAERLERDQAGEMRKLLWGAAKTGKLDGVYNGFMNRNIQGLFQGSGLSQGLEDINPNETHDLRQAVTRLGEGGISSTRAVSRDARGVQPTYFGIIDGGRAPESANAGLDMRVTDAALKGSDGQLYAPLRNLKTGKIEPLAARDMSRRIVAFPGEMAKPDRMVRAMVGDNIRFVDRKSVEYELPDATNLFSRTSNMVPMLEGVKSQRLLMGARMLSQAMPLRDAEAPLVHPIDADGKSYYETMGRVSGAVHADERGGRVVDVTPDGIRVQYEGGESKLHDLYNDYPLARKTMLHNTPTVRVGDAIQPGQLLAHSNFTDKKGVSAPGLNLRVAYLAGEGSTYDDSVVISEGAAKKLSSEHQYKHSMDLGPEVHSTKTLDYRQVYGEKFTKQQFENLDEDGAAKVGSIINPGDPIMVGIGKRQGRAVGAIMSGPKSTFTDLSQTWDHPQSGVVTDVARTRSGIKLAIKSFEPMTVGSKLSNTYGGKGVVSRIIPDAQMPHGADGRSMEVLMAPTGIITRANPSSLAVTLLGRIAEKTGQPYRVKAFGTPQGLADFALDEAKKYGVEETEDLVDPRTGRTLPKVFHGNQYILKLHHTAESKMSARDTGGYSVDGTPARGGSEGSKRIGGLDNSALLSYGATEILKDAKLIRGQKNDDYWRELKMGGTPTEPRENFANRHFTEMLRAAGVRVREKPNGSQQLGYMTDKDIDQMAHATISKSGTFDYETMKPVADGLFDLGKTGGADGTRWAKVDLGVKIPNPMAEDAIVRLLGLKGKQFEAILSGKEALNGKTGAEAIEHGLKGLDLDREIETAKQAVRGKNKGARDDAVRRLGFLTGLKRQGTQPAELMISRMPVLPPKYRPVLRAGKTDMTHDANYLYKDLMEAAQAHRESKDEIGEAGDEYLTVYRAAKAVAGLTEPVNPKTAEQGVKGVLRFAIGLGESPKYGRFQRKVLGNSVDTVGRSVITIDPALDMDSLGIPEDMAWQMFRPFAIRRLVREGMPAAEAVKSVRDRTERARKHLEVEMKARPVIYNRAPSLHRYNYVGGFAHINPHSAISISQAVTSGLGADFDGDSGLILLWIVSEASLSSWVNHEGVASMPFADTSAITYSGPIAIQDLPVRLDSKVVINDHTEEFDIDGAVKVYALDPKTGQHGWFPVTKFSVHRDLDMRGVTIGTRNPETVTVSADHSLIVYRDGVVSPLSPDESIGLMVPIAKELAGDGLESDSVQATGQFGKGTGVPGHTLWVDREHQVDLNRATGIFLGMLIGDGWISRQHATSLASAIPEIRDAWVRSAESLPYGNVDVQTWVAPSLGGVDTERGRATLCCTWFGRWLKPYIGDGALNKKIPSFSLAGPEDHLLGILDGLLTSDGTVNIVQAKSKPKPQFQVSFTTISADLVAGLQFLLRRLGVRSSVTITSSRYSGTKAYSVSISGPDFKKMVVRTGFTLSHPDKQANLVRGLPLVSGDSSVSASMDLVPYPRHLHQVFCNAARQLPGDADQNAAQCSASKKNGYWSRQVATRYCDVLKGFDADQLSELCINRGIARLTLPVTVLETLPAYLALVADRAITWKPITAVDVMPRQTGYDITVPGPLTFATASGLIVQDTINAHVPVSDKAVEETVQKLFPSKNLIHPGTMDVHLLPSQEYLAGLFMASQPDRAKPPRTFATKQDALKAYARGELSVRDPIRILE